MPGIVSGAEARAAAGMTASRAETATTDLNDSIRCMPKSEELQNSIHTAR
jgi:hypothetical protein